MKRWIPVALIAALLAGLIGWRISQKKAAEADAAKQREARTKAPVGVDAVPAARRDIIKTFEAVGSVEAPQAVDLTPKISGRILFLNVREGAPVTAGQVLVRIDPAEVDADVRLKQAAVAQAQARLAEARLGAGANTTTVETGIRQAQAALQTAQAAQRQSQADYAAQIAAAQSAVTDAQGRIDSATAAIAQAEAAIQTAKANLANGQVKLERQQTLFQEGATAKQNVDDAQTAVNVLQAAVNEANQRRNAAVASRDSARAQKSSAEKQVIVVRNKAKADIASTQAAVSQARAALTGAQANRSKTPAYQQNLEALQAAVNAAQADVRAAEARRADATLRAPFTGVVTRRNLDQGGLAAPSQPILTVQAIQQLWVTATVPEEVSQRVFEGQTAQVTFDALPGDRFAGRVIQLNPAADPQSRQFQMRVQLSNQSGQIRPGMFGRIALVTEAQRGVVVVPSEAVNKDPETGKPTVTVVGDDSVAHVTPVETGLSDARGVAILRGLNAGDKVVTLATREPKDGQVVKVGGGKRNGGGKSGEATKGGEAAAGSASPEASPSPAAAATQEKGHKS